MSAIFLWGSAPSITEAAGKLGYSRVTLHAWKRDGCPAFQFDGSVDFAKLAVWLRKNARGEKSPNTEWLAALEQIPLEKSAFAGGRNYAMDADSLNWQSIRIRELLERDGHAEAAEHFQELWRTRGEEVVNDFCDWLGEHGLAPPPPPEEDETPPAVH